MIFKTFIKKILPMSSRSLNGRLDNMMREITAGQNRLDKNNKEMDQKAASLDKRISSIERKLAALESNINTIIRLENKNMNLIYNHLDPELYPHALKQWYQDMTGNILNLEDPKTYNEKIQWMKVYDHDPRKTLLADKYLVREWVKEKIGEEYLVPLLGVYRRVEDIDFNTLPDSFVLKANHGCSMNIIVRNKAEENPDEIRRKANAWLHENFTFHNGYELQYNDIPRRIIIEKNLENADGNLSEFKIWCFHGKVQFLQMVIKNESDSCHAFFDVNWQRLSITTKILPPIEITPPAPENLSELISIAETLSDGFLFVRVDLYLVNNKQIYFDEMTFTPASGTVKWNDPDTDLLVGEMLHLPEHAGITENF